MRHRTAMVRHALSQPMSLLVQYGLVRADTTVFDYGCGQGDDLRALAGNGIVASGWDPHFAPHEALMEAETVNLGFVLNVIEDVDERRTALLEAWKLTKSTLAVSTMVTGQVSTEGLTPYRDGFVTRRGTFQKYFAHAELRSLLSDTIGSDPVAVAPGIFFVFRRSEDREEFLLRRRIGRRSTTAAYVSTRPRGARPATPDLADRIAPALVAMGEIGRIRGRLPHPDDLTPDVLALLAKERVSFQRAKDLCISTTLSPEELERAAAAMREDLLVHDALARLNRSGEPDRIGGAMMRDIKAHFGNRTELRSSSTDYLMGLADDAALRTAADCAVAEGVGAIDHNGRLLVDARRVEDLPGMLRVYLGCAAVLAGEPSGESIVRIDFQKKRVDQMRLEARASHFPRLTVTTRIDLKRQNVGVQAGERVLLAKSLILGPRTKAQMAREKKFRAERDIRAEVLTIHSTFEASAP